MTDPAELVAGITTTVAEWLNDQREYDAFDTLWDETRQVIVIKFMRNVVR